MNCPHGIPLQFVKDHGCDECLNDAYEENEENEEHAQIEYSMLELQYDRMHAEALNSKTF